MASAHLEGLYACESFLEQLTIAVDGEQVDAFNQLCKSAEAWATAQLELPESRLADIASEPDCVKRMHRGPMLGRFGFRESQLEASFERAKEWLSARNAGAENVSPGAGGWHRTIKTELTKADALRSLALQIDLERAWLDSPDVLTAVLKTGNRESTEQPASPECEADVLGLSGRSRAIFEALRRMPHGASYDTLAATRNAFTSNAVTDGAIRKALDRLEDKLFNAAEGKYEIDIKHCARRAKLICNSSTRERCGEMRLGQN